ncbi:MAG: pentapeptide repeat-containing protein [Alphaproteobacteria bacterium]
MGASPDNCGETLRGERGPNEIDRRLPHKLVVLVGLVFTAMLWAAPSNAQDADDLHQLLTTKSCPYCALENVNLVGADLRYTDVHFANLSGAKMDHADMSFANLVGVQLVGTNLTSAKLVGVALGGANLTNADLQGADLSGANLIGALLGGVILCNTIWMDGSVRNDNC